MEADKKIVDDLFVVLNGLVYGVKMNIQFDTPEDQKKYKDALSAAKELLQNRLLGEGTDNKKQFLNINQMPKIRIISSTNGEITSVKEYDVSNEQVEIIDKFFSELRDKKENIRKKFRSPCKDKC